MKKFLLFVAVMLFGITTCYATESEVNKNYVQFDVDLTYTNLQIKVYNYDTNEYIGYRLIDKEHNTYYYDKGLNIKIVDVTIYSVYETLEDIIIFNESKVINVDRKLKDLNVKFTTIYRSESGRFEREFTNTDIIIYDENFHEYATCKKSGDCEMLIKAGKYFILDKMTGRVTRENIVMDDRLVYISRPMIEGIYSEDDLNIENVTRKGNLYYFNEPTYPKEYDINREILDFSDKSKYLNIISEGIFYIYGKQDEVIEEGVTTNENDKKTIEETTREEDIIIKEEILDKEDTTKEDQMNSEENLITDTFEEEILIDVPNTENSNLTIIYYKKKNYM